MNRNNATIFSLVVAFVVVAIIAFMSMNQRDAAKSLNEKLVVQNVQLAKDVRTATVRAFRDGLIVCGNEDIAYFQGVADKYPNTAVADVFNRMADNWAYDDDKMDELTEDYMDKEY